MNYWYLGLALFVWPQLPTLLEHLGVPVTRGLHCLSNQLVQLFMGQSLLNILTEDEERVEQKNRELSNADTRVDNAKHRLKGLTTSVVSFFSSNENVDSFSAAKDYAKKSIYSLP